MTRLRRIDTVAVTALSLGLVAGCGSSSSSVSSLEPSSAQTEASATTQETGSKAAPNPIEKPAFSFDGHTEHGDRTHIEGRYGPILPPSESDVDRAALQSCQDAGDGRELVRRLDITTTITSSLAGEVRVGGFVISINEENQHAHLILDYVLDAGQGPACFRDTGEEGGTGVVDLGSLQPNEPRTFSVWVVLPDAITPNNPSPSQAQLIHEGWYMGDPAVSVNGALADSGGGEMSVVE